MDEVETSVYMSLFMKSLFTNRIEKIVSVSIEKRTIESNRLSLRRLI